MRNLVVESKVAPPQTSMAANPILFMSSRMGIMSSMRMRVARRLWCPSRKVVSMILTGFLADFLVVFFAVDFLAAVGHDAAMARAASLADRLRAGLEPLNGVEILTPADPVAHAAILAFKLPEEGGDPWDWCNLLRREHDMRLRPVGEAGLNAVRASTHLFNSEDEVDRLVEVLGALL